MSKEKAPEEKAKEYVYSKCHVSAYYTDKELDEIKYKSFLSGYHSRYVELKAYREVLKKAVGMFYKHNGTIFIKVHDWMNEAKELLNESKDENTQ